MRFPRAPQVAGVGCCVLFLSLALPASRAQAPQEPAPAALTERQKKELQADLLMARKQYAEAIKGYLEMLRQEPRNSTLLNKTGIAYHQMTRLDEAKRYYERAIKADKKCANALNNLGTIHYNRKKHRQAIKYYHRALAIQPALATVHSNLGYAYFAQKKYDEAMLAFQQALQLDPGIFDHRSSYGSVLLDRSVTDRAFFYFFLAKSFATQRNAERCAHYLRRARDEGYKGLASVATDPAFAHVLHDPAVQEVLSLAPAPAGASPKTGL